ncbi:MAG TPA: hypothetical protein DCG12_23345 [Planctomycetaceae bacterium]|nr:hypothetical protein [Planctomycetaceae bacterium]
MSWSNGLHQQSLRSPWFIRTHNSLRKPEPPLHAIAILAESLRHSGRTTVRVRVDQAGSEFEGTLGRAARGASLRSCIRPEAG